MIRRRVQASASRALLVSQCLTGFSRATRMAWAATVIQAKPMITHA